MVLNRLKVLVLVLLTCGLMGQGYNVPFKQAAAAGGPVFDQFFDFEADDCENEGTPNQATTMAYSSSTKDDCDETAIVYAGSQSVYDKSTFSFTMDFQIVEAAEITVNTCIEFRMYMGNDNIAAGSNGFLFTMDAAAGTSDGIKFNFSTAEVWAFCNGDGTKYAVTQDAWHHYQLQNSGPVDGDYDLYIDGVLRSSCNDVRASASQDWDGFTFNGYQDSGPATEFAIDDLGWYSGACSL